MTILHIKNQKRKKQTSRKTLQESHNGEHQRIKKYQNRIGANTHVNLKRGTQIFGKNMRRIFGRNTMHELEQMEEMVSLTRQKSHLTNQTYMWM